MNNPKTKNRSSWFEVRAKGAAASRRGLLPKAFTLIELLVVIAIVGVLAAVVLVSLNSARKKARDAKRLADVRQIISALNLYYDEKGLYPTPAAFTNLATRGLGSGGAGWVTGTPTGEVYMRDVQAAPLPLDGICTATQNNYRYRSTDAPHQTFELTFCLGSPAGGLLDTNSDGRVVGTATEQGITTQ